MMIRNLLVILAIVAAGCTSPSEAVDATVRPAVATVRPVPKATHRPTVDPAKGATAKCRDGTYSFSATHSGTCSHHGGVEVWYK